MKDKQILKTTVATALTFGVSLATPLAMYAQGTDLSLINSGDYADISTLNEREVEVMVHNSNTLNSSQSMNVEADSGHNSVSGNIGGSALTTGAAVAQGTFSTMGNHNMTGVTGGSGQSSMNGVGNLDFVNTGDDADVDTELSDERTVSVNNSNTANVAQSLYSMTNTGHNELDGNISGNGVGGGMTRLTTGETAVGAAFEVEANHNQTLVDIGSMGSLLGSQASLTNTGDDADVTNTSRSRFDTTIANSNTANVSQAMTGHTNSGHNSLDSNIGGGQLMTGQARFLGGFSVSANENMAGVGAANGSSGLLNIGDFVNTGDDLDADSEVSSRTRVNVGSYNYLSDTKTVSFDSNTGHNDFDSNIGNTGMTQTGISQSSHEMQVSGNKNNAVFGNTLDVLAFLLMGR